MTKLTRRKILSPLHRILCTMAACFAAAADLFGRLTALTNRAAVACDPAQGAADMIELRDAMTGEPLGLTKAHYRRFVVALGSDSPEMVAKAVSELRARRRSVLAAMATAACLILAPGCTRSNDARLCVAGEQQVCACPGGAPGAQACEKDGYGFEACMCPDQLVGHPDLAGADLAGADLIGVPAVDMAGLTTQSDLANPAFVGITCGAQSCGPVGGRLACCSTVSSSGTTEGCVEDSTNCPSGTNAQAECDGPEDCPGQACDVSLETMTTSSALNFYGAQCKSPVANVIVHNSSGSVDVHSVACHSNADCAGQTGTAPLAGSDTPFDHCCTYVGYAKGFCASQIIAGGTFTCL